MRKLTLALILVLGLTTPCFAALRLTEFQKKHKAVVESVSDTDGTVNGIVIVFKAGATQPQQDAVNADKLVFNFVAPPAPNYTQFMADCFADGTIPAATRRDISQIGLWVKVGEKDLAVAVWDQIKGALAGGVKTAIRGHATDNNITLPN